MHHHAETQPGKNLKGGKSQSPQIIVEHFTRMSYATSDLVSSKEGSDSPVLPKSVKITSQRNNRDIERFASDTTIIAKQQSFIIFLQIEKNIAELTIVKARYPIRFVAR